MKVDKNRFKEASSYLNSINSANLALLDLSEVIEIDDGDSNERRFRWKLTGGANEDYIHRLYIDRLAREEEMNYYIDTEFLEGKQLKRGKPTIDLISIGILKAKDPEAIIDTPKEVNPMEALPAEYYAISKDFNLKAAWDRCQMDSYDRMGNLYSTPKKVYWIRDKVLKPIFKELVQKELDYYKEMFRRINTWTSEANPKKHIFNKKNFKRLLEKYGKTNDQIAEEILDFCSNGYFDDTGISFEEKLKYELYGKFKPIFYGYFADYDWVALCWLFGSMIELPYGFPTYCCDLKQLMDENYLDTNWKRQNCPDLKNEHNALADAKWNYALHKQIIKHIDT